MISILDEVRLNRYVFGFPGRAEDLSRWTYFIIQVSMGSSLEVKTYLSIWNLEDIHNTALIMIKQNQHFRCETSLWPSSSLTFSHPTLIIQLFRSPLNYWYPFSEHLTAGHDCKYAIAYEKAHRTKNQPNRKKTGVREWHQHRFCPFFT